MKQPNEYFTNLSSCTIDWKGEPNKTRLIDVVKATERAGFQMPVKAQKQFLEKQQEAQESFERSGVVVGLTKDDKKEYLKRKKIHLKQEVEEVNRELKRLVQQF